MVDLAVAREKVLAPLYEDPVLTLQESAECLHVPVGTLRSWVQSGAVNVVRIGRKIFLSVSEIRRLRSGGFALR